jgi:hypothetical protein
MAETLRAFVGVRDVAFTPDGADAQPIPCLDGLDEEVVVEEIVHPNADGVYDVFAWTRRLSRRVSLRSKDLVALAGLAVNAVGTLAWTLVGKGLAEDRPLGARARVLAPVAWSSGEGSEPVVGRVVLQLLSEDGLTDPIGEQPGEE